MRQAIALISSLLILSGCAAVNNQGFGPSEGHSWNGFGQGGPFGGRTLARAFPNQGCSTGCDAGCGPNGANETGFDCGPMCGAYLTDHQTSCETCNCQSCQVGNSYVKSNFGQWFEDRQVAWSRGGRAAAGAPSVGSFPAGPCRGLGAMVGCLGCNECGDGSAVGLSHSSISAGDCSCGLQHCPGGHNCLAKAKSKARGFVSKFLRFGGTPHPYGGELPHTASASLETGGGAAAPAYAYPYYTTRGPRDFLMMNPPSIGR
jgi:hypothetical protein